jgi:DNA-binding response OmpR family regulator
VAQARIKNTQSNKHLPHTFELDGLVLNQAGQEVTVNGIAHHLTPKECRLLATLMQHAGQILTREFLMQEVWDTHYTGDTRTVEVHIAWLRKKIEEDTSNPQRILTVRGAGYMLTGRS